MSALGLRFFLIMLMLSDYVILTLHAPSVVGAWREGAALLYILLMVLIAFFFMRVLALRFRVDIKRRCCWFYSF